MSGNSRFIGREQFLELIRKGKENLKNGQPEFHCLIGQRNIGKTSILNEFIYRNKDVITAHIDLEKISLSPESFAIEFVNEVGHQITDSRKVCKDIIGNITNELEKIKPNQNQLLNWAFSFLEEYAKRTQQKAVLILDEIHKVLDFNNFSQIKNVLDIIGSISLNNSSILSASSASNDAKKISDHLGYKVLEISGLDRESTKELANSIIKLKESEIDLLYSLTSGVPLYIYAICKRYLKIKDIKKSYVIEILSKQGLIHNALNYTIMENMSRARGQTLLHSILKVLCDEPLRLTDIGSKIYRSGPVTKSLVDRLVLVDIVKKNGRHFSIQDNVLKFFVKNIFVNNNILEYEFEKMKVAKIAKEVKQ